MAAAVSSSRFLSGQFVRYLCAGGFNTAFGYADFGFILFLLRNLLPQKYLYFTVVIASLSTGLQRFRLYWHCRF